MNREQLVVVWRIYEPCNLGCPFCGYSREIVRQRHITSPEAILNFGRTLSEFQQRTGCEVLVSWLGGEPLLWKELSSISHIYHSDYDIQLGITTNGTTLDHANVRANLIGHYSFVTISIDGFAEFHDFHRGDAGLFEKIEKVIPVFLDEIESSHSPLRLRVNTILMRENIHQFESFCMEMADWGFQELTFNQLGGIDRPDFYPDHRLLPEQADCFARELPSIQQKAHAKGLKIFGARPYLERIIATSNNAVIPIEDCRPGRRFLFINEEDKISPCNFTTQGYGIPLAEIENADALIKLPERFRHTQIHQRAKPCGNCHSTQVFEKFSS